MRIKLNSLILQFKEAREIIEFSPQITFFHGKTSSGKSSIARLIDFCLGGSLERTPALAKELVSAGLSTNIGDNEVLFERDSAGTNIQVTWKDKQGKLNSVLAPLQQAPNSKPIWADDIFSVSDLVFYFLDLTPIKVRRSKANQESPMIRLSFRDVMWYCYLAQAHLDSSFYRFDDPIRSLKSRDVMRFTVGFYTERMSDLEIELEILSQQRIGKVEAAKQINEFLKQFGYGTALEVETEKEQTRKELQDALSNLESIRQGHVSSTHLTDELRAELRGLGSKLESEQQALIDLERTISEQDALRAELLSAKFKATKSQDALTILAGVSYETCPLCGKQLHNLHRDENMCKLCGQTLAESVQEQNTELNLEVLKKDLDARIEDLAESIQRHNQARRKQQRSVERLQQEKISLDQKLTEEVKNYDSLFLARSRDIERKIATFEERMKSLDRAAEMPSAVTKLEQEAEDLRRRETEIRKEIQTERESLKSAYEIVHEIERTFLRYLLEVGVPGVSSADQVVIDLKKWMPQILPAGEQLLRWDFYNAGSGGKKTLLNVCYALAVHNVAAIHNLPLPTFLMIDTPTKNISPDVNKEMFIAFYQLLYRLAATTLSKIQLIIIDNEFVEPEVKGIEIKRRYMTPNEDEHPPLIPYYRGP